MEWSIAHLAIIDAEIAGTAGVVFASQRLVRRCLQLYCRKDESIEAVNLRNTMVRRGINAISALVVMAMWFAGAAWW